MNAEEMNDRLNSKILDVFESLVAELIDAEGQKQTLALLIYNGFDRDDLLAVGFDADMVDELVGDYFED